jgi:hypothetical protein
MKTLVEYLQKKQLIFKSLKEITPRELNSRKKVSIYLAIDLKSYYTLIIEITKKSRILQKEVDDFLSLHDKAQDYNGSAINKKIIIINAPLCSKAKAKFIDNGWKVFVNAVS